MPKDFLLPDLGEGIVEAQVIRLLIKQGDTIVEDQSLMEVETDKAAVEIPSPFAGVATTVHVSEGQTVSVGDVIVSFDNGAPAESKPAAKKTVTASAGAAAAEKAPAPPVPAPARTPAASTNRKTTVSAAPVVRKRARELGIELSTVPSSGPGGRVTMDDLERHAGGSSASGAAATATPTAGSTDGPIAPTASRTAVQPYTPPPGEVGQDKWGTIRRAPLNQLRKTIAARMTQSAFTAVHVTHGDNADITELDRIRRSLNEATGSEPKLTAMSFIIRAVCIALRKYPIFNASFDEQSGQIIYKDYINIGVAVDSGRGLIVPVIRNADTLSLAGIAQTLRQIAEQVRSNKFSVEDLRGGTFTITNVGALGGTFSTPIINYPEVAILGTGRSRKVAIVRDNEVVPALVLPLNLSFDHRAADGANAARFTGEIISFLEMPTRFLLH